jgi:hypothetical protein
MSLHISEAWCDCAAQRLLDSRQREQRPHAPRLRLVLSPLEVLLTAGTMRPEHGVAVGY